MIPDVQIRDSGIRHQIFFSMANRSSPPFAIKTDRAPAEVPTPRLQSVDIDEPADWFMAESLLMRVVAGETLPEA